MQRGGMRVVSVVLLISLGAIRKGEVHGATAAQTSTLEPVLTEDKDVQFKVDSNSQGSETGSSSDKVDPAVFNRRRRSNANGLTPDQYYQKLMSMLTSKENVFQAPKVKEQIGKESDTDFVDDDDEGEVIELYGSNPYPFSSIESAEKRPYADKVKVFGGDTISLMRSRPPGPAVEDLWEDMGGAHSQAAERRSRSPIRFTPVNGLSQYRVANSKREFSPFERRVFTQPYQRLARRNLGAIFG